MAGKTKYNAANIRAMKAAGQQALLMAADATLTDIVTKGTMPFDYGTMQNDQTFVDKSSAQSDRVSIVTSAPQAARLYFHPEYNFQTVNNSGAGAAWFEPWLDGVFVKQAFTKMWSKLNHRLEG